LDLSCRQGTAGEVGSSRRRPPGAPTSGGPALPQDGVELTIDRAIGPGLIDHLTVANHSAVPLTVVLRIRAEPDFADVQEVGSERRQHGTTDATDAPAELTWLYRPSNVANVLERGARIRATRDGVPTGAAVRGNPSTITGLDVPCSRDMLPGVHGRHVRVPSLGTASIPGLLTAWREAERRWERQGSPDEVRAAALKVVEAYAAYQTAALPADSGEFVMVADDDGVYVAVTAGVTNVLGYAPDDLVGRRIDDISAPEQPETTRELWTSFILEGRQDGRFRVRAQDGRLVWLRYQARAHHPVAGFHISRLWPDVEPPKSDARAVGLHRRR
jgi:PAS domain S-box-containing protein